MPTPRPRRLLFTLLAFPVLFLFLIYLGSPASRRALSGLFSTSADPSKLPDEIFGLLHFVTSPDEAGRVITTDDTTGSESLAFESENENHDGDHDTTNGIQPGGVVIPEKPIPLTWYALGSLAKSGSPSRAHERSADAEQWDEWLMALREQYPLVVFSKTYCPYSKRAKSLLETYKLLPAPKIVEVDMRADASHIKTVLTRLTHRSTFPNVILHGRSVGGSDDLIRLHEEGKLRAVLEKGGIKVGSGEA